MNPEAQFQRATVLIQQDRYTDASKILRELLTSDPEESQTLTYLAICLVELNELEEAEVVLQQCISLMPNHSLGYRLMGSVKLRQEKLKDAHVFIDQAIALNPEDANCFGIQAYIHIAGSKWKEALASADKGLEHDPEDLTCLNARSTALIKLDKKEEAFNTIDEALHHDPENPFTHANVGWGELEKGDHTKALDHFREALMYDPTSEYAKSGMVEALKARYGIYRIWLKYCFWIGNMSGKMQIVVIVGYLAVNRILKTAAELAPILWPVFWLLMAVVISSWLITPLSNLFLRFNVYGKHALTKDELITSNFVGGALVAGMAGMFLGWMLRSFALMAFGGVSLILMIPLGHCFDTSNPKLKLVRYYTLTMAGLGVMAIHDAYVYNVVVHQYFFYVIVGAVAFTWLSGFLRVRL